MFHKINSVKALDNYILKIRFAEGITKLYDLKPWFKIYPKFKQIKNSNLYYEVFVDVGGHGIVWNDDLDLSCEELYNNGKKYKSPFDDLMSFRDATLLWNLNESTLRKAIVYGKLIEGEDVCKFGKQWVISMKAMEREYGKPNK